MNLIIVPGMFVYSSFLISVCMFIVSKALLLCKEEDSFPVSAITERSDMGLYEVPLSVSLL